MWMRCLCLLLLCQQALNIQIISREVSEASLDINTEPFHHVSGPAKCLSLKDKSKSDSCLVERCTEQCLVREQNNKQQNEREYKIGCKLMQSFFTSVKEKFPQTEPEYLLGSAIDQCWEDCTENYTPCTMGCVAMRDIQKQIMNLVPETRGQSSSEETQEQEEKEEEEEVSSEETELDGSETDSIPVVRSYVLWRPSGANMESVYTNYNTIISIIQEMFGDTMEEGRAGYQDDRRQFSLPGQGYRIAAREEEEVSQADKAKKTLENVYENIRQRFDSVVMKMKSSLQSPKYRELIFYVLLSICCFLILTAIFDILSENRKQRSDEIEDHYLLEDTSIKAKLPTYDECLMQDTVKYKLAVHLEEEEDEKNNEKN